MIPHSTDSGSYVHRPHRKAFWHSGITGRSHWSWLYSALSTTRDLFTIAQFGRITRAHQALSFTTWQKVQVGGIIVDSVPFFFSNMSNCEQTAVCLFGMLPFTLAVCLRPEEMTS